MLKKDSDRIKNLAKKQSAIQQRMLQEAIAPKQIIEESSFNIFSCWKFYLFLSVAILILL